jgi:hypothetical protein
MKTLILLIILSACSSRVIVKDCQELGRGLFECKER